jgi:MFS family permease
MIGQLFNSTFKPAPAVNPTENNIRFLYIEIFWAAILGAITTYNALFAVRLGADTALVGILTAAPALVQAILSIPSARYLESRSNHKAWLFGSLLFMRLGHLGMVILPWVAPYNTSLWLVVWILVLVAPLSFFSNGFNAMLAEIIPDRRRAFVFSRRTIIWSLTNVGVLLITGTYLEWSQSRFPLNYQIMYLVGTICALGSQHYLMKLVVAEHKEALERRSAAAVRLTGATQTATKLPADSVAQGSLSPVMRRMLFNTFVYQFGVFLPGPLFVVHYANTLKISDGLISLNGAVGTLGVVFGLVLWEALIRKWGFAWALRTATCFTWIFPFTVGVTQDFYLIIFANLIVNMIHPGFDLSAINVVLNACKPEQRNMYMSYYTTVFQISAFIAPLLAIPLVNQLGIMGAMLIAASLRLTGGFLFQRNRVEVEARPAASEPSLAVSR